MKMKKKISDPVLICVNRRTAAELKEIIAHIEKTSKETVRYDDVILLLLGEYKKRQL